ncbi:MAG: hypothetical protein D6795_07545 [Deltaproteobacteria bacterium]|nr:MAG: hypothetical protein D6795_07545 [Deltaproteobacteria bacterium]
MRRSSSVDHREAFHAALRRISSVFHRRMNPYAKTPEALVRALALQQVAHDGLPSKETHEATPTMKRGSTDRPWTFEEILHWRFRPPSPIPSVPLVN